MLKLSKNLCLPVLLVIAAVFGGCNSQPFVNPERMDRGLVVVLPGIEGRGMLNAAIARGLNDGGISCAIELYDWTSALGLLYNLRAEEHNLRKAKELARHILRYQLDYPDRPVLIVGHSGGGAMGVWAAESMEDNRKIDGLILLNTSLSPGYDLSNALEHTRRGIVNIYSSRDRLLLGLGTSMYGTMDGKHEASAGMTGFRIPDDMPEAYVKLFQMGWTKQMADAGHRGGHFSSSASEFISLYIAPLVKSTEWSSQLIENIMDGTAGETFDSPTTAPTEHTAPTTAPTEQPDENPGIKAVPTNQLPESWL